MKAHRAKCQFHVMSVDFLALCQSPSLIFLLLTMFTGVIVRVFTLWAVYICFCLNRTIKPVILRLGNEREQWQFLNAFWPWFEGDFCLKFVNCCASDLVTSERCEGLHKRLIFCRILSVFLCTWRWRVELGQISNGFALCQSLIFFIVNHVNEHLWTGSTGA